jgi:pimeloyl-ACP methyl ester carboxylesterase
LPPGQDPAAVECGFAIVPEDRKHENGRTVQIAYAVFKATDPDPVGDPIVYLDGGPGAPTVDDAVYILPWFESLRARRDLVLFDQRGSGRSRPSLDCPEWRDAFSHFITVPQDVAADAAELLSAIQSCHERLKSEGIDFGAFTSSASAHDLEDLMLALGYEEWNLYGISYGTRLGLTALRDTPAHIRSITLDSTLPVEANLFADYAANLERSLGTLFSGCAQDVSCNAAYPNLAGQLWALVEELNANPLTLNPANPETGEPSTVIITGDRLLLILHQALYDSDVVPFVPMMISSMAQGDYGLLMLGVAKIGVPRNAWGMYYSISCNEEIPFVTPEIVAAATAEVREEIERVEVTYFTQLTVDTCAFWDSRAPRRVENEPVAGDIPALIFAGEYDPTTPPRYGEAVAENLSHSSFFEFPATGHGVIVGRRECASAIALQFLTSPGEPLDGACAAAIPPPDFAVP